MLESRLCRLVLDVVRERWCQGETAIGSDAVYGQLVQAGVPLSPTVLQAVVNVLKARRLIRVDRPFQVPHPDQASMLITEVVADGAHGSGAGRGVLPQGRSARGTTDPHRGPDDA